MTRILERPLATIICTLLTASMLSGCNGDSRTPGEDRVGDMSDRSYFDARGKTRVAANGDSVRFEQFAGHFVWANYTAPWCGYCEKQSPALRQVEDTTGGDVVFLTVMTSDMGGYGDPATRSTAKQWSRRHGLDQQRVLAADLTAIRVPRHILFSPEGQMLFLHSGYLPAERIREIIATQTSEWNGRAQLTQAR